MTSSDLLLTRPATDQPRGATIRPDSDQETTTMTTTLRITYRPSATPVTYVATRHGVDIYYCGAVDAVINGKHHQHAAGYAAGSRWDGGRPPFRAGARYGDPWTRDIAPSLDEAAARLRSAAETHRRAVWRDACAADRREADAAKSRAREITRSTCTVESVLASTFLRGLVADDVAGGRSWSAAADEWIPRQVQRAAQERLRARRSQRAARGTAEQARAGTPGRIVALLPVYAERRRRAAEAAERKRLLAGRLGRARLDHWIATASEQVSDVADAVIRQVVRAVGTIGDQAADDLERMGTSESFSGRRGRHHRRDVTTLHRVEHLDDWSAVLLTLRDYASFGSSRDGGYATRGGSSYRCYLVVRDATTGEAHILRVPPKFGNSDTQFFRSFGRGGICSGAVGPRGQWGVQHDDAECQRAITRIVRAAARQDETILTAGWHAGRTEVLDRCRAECDRIAGRRRVTAAREWTFAGHSLAGAIEA